MSDPFTAFTVGSTALSGIGSLVGASGAQDAARAKADNDNYKAYVAAQNAQIALQNRQRDLDVGNQQAFNQDLRARQQIGGAEADAGASGFTMTGSVSKGIESLHMIDRMNTQQIIGNAQMKAYGDVMRSYDFTREAIMDQRSAQGDLAAGDTQAFSTLLGGATSVADRWAGYYRQR